MTSVQLEKDLARCLSLMEPSWPRQNNRMDRRTKFVYDCDTLEQCLKNIERYGADRNYALHRWYNHKTGIVREYIFCEYGAVHSKDKYDHDVDIYIKGEPFDVKLTVYPARLPGRQYNLRSREGKDGMIRWFYQNQSQQGRKQLTNRLYVVCGGATAREKMRKKSDFHAIRTGIRPFMEDVKIRGVQTIAIPPGGHKVKSDIIYLP